jgi:O-antigen ligase
MLFLFISSFNLRKLLIFPIIASLIIFTVIISKSDKIKNRMIDTTTNQLGLSEKSERLVLFSKIYEGHYLIALKMFKEKPIFGHGPKMFRFYCSKEENFVADNACTTHPHNFYAQILAETGLVGFLFLLTIFLYILFLFLKNFYFQIKYKKQLISDLGLCLLSSYFITFFPILPSGNFFNNWLSIMIYYPLGFLIYTIKNNKFYV